MSKVRFPHPEPFFDRAVELDALERSWQRTNAGLALLYGRRRLGKTYLLQRFLSDVQGASGRCYYLADQSTAEVQRLSLAERLVEAFPAGLAAREIAASWNALLRYFGARARDAGEGKAALVLDEFPYLVAQTPELPSVLQAWWDEEGRHARAFVVLCGSQLSTMAALSDETAPLHGRFNAGRIRLEPMGYGDVAAFYEGMEGYGPRERLLMYGALGGTPRYHGEIERGLPWDAQIVDLLLRPGAPFEGEARALLASEQIRDPAPYNAILGAVAQGRTRNSEIMDATGIAPSASLSRPLDVLQELGWLRREVAFGETSHRRAIYRLADPFLAFWYRFGAPLASVLRFEDSMAVFRERIEPRLDDYMGWSVFEDVCGQWLRRRARSDLRLDVRGVDRYWSRDGRVEIDQVAELGGGGLLFGECKWSARSPVGVGVYAALRAKVEALPHEAWRKDAQYALYALGGFTEEMRAMAKSEGNVHLVDGARLF